MTVTATDRGTPQQSDSATITINIVRNTQSPVFTNSGQYATTIDQNLNIGTSVFTVTATDGDTVVCIVIDTQTTFVLISFCLFDAVLHDIEIQLWLFYLTDPIQCNHLHCHWRWYCHFILLHWFQQWTYYCERYPYKGQLSNLHCKKYFHFLLTKTNDKFIFLLP